MSLLQKISILFRFNRSALKVFLQTPELVIPYLQWQFYVVRRQELTEERAQLEKKLEQYAFDEKMAELTEKSLRLFQAEKSSIGKSPANALRCGIFVESLRNLIRNIR